MNLSRILNHRIRCVVGGLVVIVLCAAALSQVPLAKANSSNTASSSTATSSTSTTGSGARYETIVDRKTEGQLSDEDFKQVSLLATRIVKHVNSATEHLADDNSQEAKSEVENAQKLTKIVRDMLPVTVIDTVVKDSDGNEVYRNSDRVQDDQIPIFEKMIAVEVVEPIADAKKVDAELKGIRLTDADLVRTSVLLDLNYVERKLNRCAQLLEDKPEDALNQLVFAQKSGIRFVTNKEDHPLVEAQLALSVAERMAENEKYEAANANLQIARNHLELYRGLAGKSTNDRVNELDKDIQKVMKEIEKPNAAKEIRGFWGRLTSWFKPEAGQAQSTDSEAESETEASQEEALVKTES